MTRYTNVKNRIVIIICMKLRTRWWISWWLFTIIDIYVAYLSIYIILLIHACFYRVGYKSAVSRELCRLMKLPVDYFNNIITILELKHYAALIECFDYYGRKNLALYLVNDILSSATFIPDSEQVSVARFHNLNFVGHFTL